MDSFIGNYMQESKAETSLYFKTLSHKVNKTANTLIENKTLPFFIRSDCYLFRNSKVLSSCPCRQR